MDSPETFDPKADSTYVMITEALQRGHRPFGTNLDGLSLHGAVATARVAPVGLDDADPPRLRYTEPASPRLLSSFGAVLMRKDPPVDQAYVTATWILDHAGTLVLNAPTGLRSLNEKLSILRFGDLVPRTFISRNADELREILETLGGRMIVKPVYGFGGREILLARADDPNLGSLLELATAEGTRWTVAQEYLPAAAEGDKRILLVDGDPIGAVLRVPAKGELRNNFHAGGQASLGAMNERDRAICSAIRPMLRQTDQFFVGIDVIGGRLTEINVTSPTGMQEINRLESLTGEATMQARFWDALTARMQAHAEGSPDAG
ncbi:MAG: glutathione synthase [Deltaproteobacteria bacterium]|nr:glutathione synthase [Deltaproteobacteria bacterium]